MKERIKNMSDVTNVTCNVQQNPSSLLQSSLMPMNAHQTVGKKNVDYAASLIISLCFNVTTYVVHTHLHNFSFFISSQYRITVEVSVPTRSALTHSAFTPPNATIIGPCNIHP
jgi:hypothetical protein